MCFLIFQNNGVIEIPGMTEEMADQVGHDGAICSTYMASPSDIKMLLFLPDGPVFGLCDLVFDTDRH